MLLEADVYKCHHLSFLVFIEVYSCDVILKLTLFYPEQIFNILNGRRIVM